jgi:Tol biopolymer transport system component
MCRIPFVILLSGLLIGISISPLNAQTTRDQYAYMVITPDGQGMLYLVDPSAPLQAALLTELPIHSGETLGGGYLSPTGEWVLLYLHGSEAQIWRLFNLENGETLDVLTNAPLADPPPTLNGPAQVLSWSPDGRFFALSYEPGPDRTGLYIYNVVERRLINLAPLDTNHYRLAWSSSSTRLATTSFTCSDDLCSRTAVDIFDASTGALTSSIDVASLSTGPAGQTTNFCDLQWSPDDTHISFIHQCDSAAFGSPREIHVADLMHSTVIQVTDFTPTDIDPTELLFQTQYETAWANAGTLVISVVLQEAVLLGDLGVDKVKGI